MILTGRMDAKARGWEAKSLQKLSIFGRYALLTSHPCDNMILEVTSSIELKDSSFVPVALKAKGCSKTNRINTPNDVRKLGWMTRMN